MLRQFVPVLVLVVALSSTSLAFGDADGVMKIKSPKGGIGPQLHTNIALVGAEEPVSTLQQDQPNVIVDPSKLYDQASEEFRKTDIEEDPEDRFVTTRSGKPRVQLVDEEEVNWADESPLIPNSLGSQQVLVRKKRCGGGDDDGGAQRARRARRARRTRRARRQRRAQRKAARRAARTKTTTITRTILPANQAVATAYQGQTLLPATTQAGAQVYVQQQQPGQVIQTVQTHQPQVQVMTGQPQVQFQGQAMAGVQPMAMGGSVAAVATA